MIEGLSVEDRREVVKTGNSHKPAVRFRKNNEPNQGHLESKHSILYHSKNKGNNTFLNSLEKQAKIPVILLKTKVCLKHSLSKIFYPHNNYVHHPSEWHVLVLAVYNTECSTIKNCLCCTLLIL